MKKVLIIPGLGDHVIFTKITVRNWYKYGLEPVVYSMNWSDKENFDLKFKKLVEFTSSLYKDNQKISVVGCSAVASMALNLFLRCPNNIEKAISVCGRLRKGDQTGFRSLEIRSRKSPVFKKSVQLFESQENNLNDEQRKRIMTVSSLFIDELVPSNTSALKGALNVQVPMVGHSMSIYSTLSIFSKQIIDFLKK